MHVFISPALRSLLERRIPAPDQQPIIDRLTLLAASEILAENDLAQRSSGTSFNPALCRVVAILIESANADSAAKLLPHLDELASGNPANYSVVTSAAVTLDQIRHLHQSSATPEQKKSLVIAAQTLAKTWGPSPEAQALHTQLSAWLSRYGDRY